MADDLWENDSRMELEKQFEIEDSSDDGLLDGSLNGVQGIDLVDKTTLQQNNQTSNGQPHTMSEKARKRKGNILMLIQVSNAIKSIHQKISLLSQLSPNIGIILNIR